jgi:hypothetical protein
LGTGLAVVNSNLPLSPRRDWERAAEAGLRLHGRAPRLGTARGRGTAWAGAQGTPRARGGGSTCGARDRECARLWVYGEGGCGGGRAHLRTGSTGCAVRGTRNGSLGGAGLARVDGGHAPIQKGCGAFCHLWPSKMPKGILAESGTLARPA